MIANLEEQECINILNNNYVGHLAYIYNNLPYVIPITYFYDQESITVIAYSGEGHKIKALRINKFVSLEISEIKSVNDWKSILVHGTFEELEGPDAKYELHKFALGVKKLIAKNEDYTLHFIPEFSGKTNSEAMPVVYRINIKEITGKERKSNKSAQQRSTSISKNTIS